MEAPSSAVIQMALFEFGVSAVTRICRRVIVDAFCLEQFQVTTGLFIICV